MHGEKVRRSVLALAIACSVGSGALLLLTGWEFGLTRSVLVDETSPEHEVGRRVTSYIGSESFDKERRDSGLAPGRRFQWTGIWDVPVSGTYEISARAANRVAVMLDDRVVLERSAPADRANATQVALKKGAHAIAIAYAPNGTDQLSLSWASDGSGPRPFGQAALYPNLRMLRISRWLRPLEWSALLSWLLLATIALGRLLRSSRPWTSWTGAVIGPLVIGVFIYAALLRFDAVVGRWGLIPGSAAAQTFQRQLVDVAGHLRPAHLALVPSEYPLSGDPYGYLQEARERTNFFGASLREPLYPFSIKPFLAMLGQADEAVSVTSAFFSWLTVVATFLLGSLAFSPGVGLGAALALAVDGDAIHLGVAGNRDDAFAFFVVAVALVSLWAHKRPTPARSVLWGLVAGAACLTRITAVSFVLPALAYRIWREPGPTRARSTIVSVSALLLVVAPFAINCWIRFGTPFYPVTGIISSWDFGHGMHASSPQPMGWSQYLTWRLASRPISVIDALCTAALHAFDEAWQGFLVWPVPGLGPFLAACAFAGLVGCWWSPAGRLLLLVIATSPMPYLLLSETLSSTAQDRYTLHLLPFFLVGAFLTIERVVSGLGVVLRGETIERPALRSTLKKACLSVALVVAGWLVAGVIPYERMMEDLRHGDQTMVAVGSRDLLFFPRGWHSPSTLGTVTSRDSIGGGATVWIPLLAGHDITLTVRLDPMATDGTHDELVQFTLNGVVLSRSAAGWDPEHIGSYAIRIPPQIARTGLNRLEIAIAHSMPAGAAATLNGGVRLWYVLVDPKPAA